MSREVRVGTGLIVVRDAAGPHDAWRGKVLVGKRKGSHAAGLYSFPGGHQDFGESWEDCVLRELLEECGPLLKVKLRPVGVQRALFVTDDYMPQFDNHYNTVFMLADWIDGEACNMEPKKCEGWEWITYDQLAALAQHKECANWIPMEYITSLRDVIGI